MTNFLSLPSELRNEIYRLVLVSPDPLDCVHGCYPPGNVAILRASKQIHAEARSVLYMDNTFSFDSATQHDVSAFLQRIGSNTDLIRHIYLDDPFSSWRYGRDEDDVEEFLSLPLFRSYCKNLETITTSLKNLSDDYKNIMERLASVDDRVRSIAPSVSIKAEIYKEDSNVEVRKRLEELSWTLIECERTGDSFLWDSADWESASVYDYMSETGDSMEDASEYDIDNDSDFWRRAGD